MSMPAASAPVALKRADSIPSSSGVAVPPPLPPSPTPSLPGYTWEVVRPASAVPKSPKGPPSPVLSYTDTFVNDSADKKRPIGRTYIFRFIPSRIGVAVFASMMFICSIGMAVSASLIMNRLEGHLTPVQRLAIIFQILNYLFVAIASIVGLYAIISILHRNAVSPLARARKASQLFCGLLLGHLPFSVASGALSIHIVFKATTRALRASIKSAELAASKSEGQAALASRAFELVARGGAAKGPASKPLACWVLEGTQLYWLCEKTPTIKALIVILYLALWFLEVVCLYAGTRYSSQLQSVEMIKNVDDEEAANY